MDTDKALLGSGVRIVSRINTGKSRPQTGMRRGSVTDQSLPASLVEETAVVKLRLLALPIRGVAHGVPRIEMRIEVQHRDRLLVNLVQSTQRRQRNTVVATESNKLGMSRADGVLALGRLVHRLAGTELQEGFVHLALGQPVVEGRDGDVAAVGDLGPGLVRVDPRAGVVACSCHLASGCGADGAWTEASTGSVADGCVEGCADHGDVVVLSGLDETLDGVEVGKAGDAGEGPLDSLECVRRARNELERTS